MVVKTVVEAVDMDKSLGRLLKVALKEKASVSFALTHTMMAMKSFLAVVQLNVLHIKKIVEETKASHYEETRLPIR